MCLVVFLSVPTDPNLPLAVSEVGTAAVTLARLARRGFVPRVGGHTVQINVWFGHFLKVYLHYRYDAGDSLS